MRRKQSSAAAAAAAAGAPTKGVARSFGSVDVVGGIDRTRSTTTWLRNGIPCSQAPIELHQGPSVELFANNTRVHTHKQASKHNDLVLFSNGIG